MRPLSTGNPQIPSELPTGYLILVYVDLRGLARTLIRDYGCEDTARFQLVVRAGDNSLHSERLEIAHPEAWAADDIPIQGRIEG